MESFISPAYLDARVFMVYGDCPCLVYGPYSENIHGFDERSEFELGQENNQDYSVIHS